jgi:hypothetical protein
MTSIDDLCLWTYNDGIRIDRGAGSSVAPGLVAILPRQGGGADAPRAVPMGLDDSPLNTMPPGEPGNADALARGEGDVKSSYT